ncbi:basic salivary proline-rich protein 1-like [Muntiacus reevesi]|uniref:basic salivary proline-rich protein 1-like n=1 Tax=Muntiacus reevesi TaxID=9886 RepID=UPI003307238C
MSLALILLDVSREVPRPLQTSPSHPPTPCSSAYGLNPGPERLRQPVWTSSVRPLGLLSRGPPSWGQLTPEPPPSGRGRGLRPEWTRPPWGLQRSTALLAQCRGETEAQSGRGPARDGPRCPPPAQAERPFPLAHAPGSNTELQNKQAAAPAAAAADGWPEGLAVLTDGRPSCVGRGGGPRGCGHRRTLANWGLASPHPETLQGQPTRRPSPRLVSAQPRSPNVRLARGKVSSGRPGQAGPPEAVVSPCVCRRAATGPSARLESPLGAGAACTLKGGRRGPWSQGETGPVQALPARPRGLCPHWQGLAETVVDTPPGRPRGLPALTAEGPRDAGPKGCPDTRPEACLSPGHPADDRPERKGQLGPGL